MDAMRGLFDWFAGGRMPDGQWRYMNLIHCMGHDYLWIAITVALDLAVAAGYGLIAMHWWKNQRFLPDIPAKRALANMRNIFLFCGICGYIFIPIKMVWPAWRLYDVFMFVLVYFTWKYAWSAKDLKVVYSELGRSSRLQADLDQSRQDARRKSFFLNAVSHDLRTPLNGLILQANLAEISATTQDQEGLRKALAEIKASTRATADLLDSLLEYSRLEQQPASSVGRMTFSIGVLLDELRNRFQAVATQKGLALRTSVRGDDVVTSERASLERILVNLMTNAIKFTQQGSVRVEALNHGDALEIHVIDTGVGIDPSVQDRLFDEFFQVHNDERDPRKGFGLGLSIARRLAQQLGGEITVDSSPGRGSRFTLLLPQAAATDPGFATGEPGAAVALP